MQDMIPRTWTTHILRSALAGNCTVAIPDTWHNEGFILLQGDSWKNPLVRIHSRCSYGDLFGSTHCDCSQQFQSACRVFRNSKTGSILFYLEQEGRGAGIQVKGAAYQALSENGIDTFSFYRTHYGRADLRSYRIVSSALKAMNIRKIRLLTNNPNKVEQLQKQNIDVTRIPHRQNAHPNAHSYMQAKKEEGHLV